jgi:hypothetical protein
MPRSADAPSEWLDFRTVMLASFAMLTRRCYCGAWTITWSRRGSENAPVLWGKQLLAIEEVEADKAFKDCWYGVIRDLLRFNRPSRS